MDAGTPPVVLALTGTPGTGKSTLATELAKRDCPILDLTSLVKERGLHSGPDIERDILEVDLEQLAPLAREWVDTEAAKGNPKATTQTVLILEGHLSHELGLATHILALRCEPRVLKERLEARGYSPAKVSENCEAEALDVILVEALEAQGEGSKAGQVIGKTKVRELDTTATEPAMAASEVMAWLKGADHELQLPGTARWLSGYLEE